MESQSRPFVVRIITWISKPFFRAWASLSHLLAGRHDR
jgi:hypothetical protein